MLVQGDQAHDESKPDMARHIAESIARSLESFLIPRRLRRPQVEHVPVGIMVVDSVPLMRDAWQVHIPFSITRYDKAHMRPSALRILCFHDDLIMVVASGNGAWQFKRLQLPQVIEKAQDVLPPL